MKRYRIVLLKSKKEQIILSFCNLSSIFIFDLPHKIQNDSFQYAKIFSSFYDQLLNKVLNPLKYSLPNVSSVTNITNVHYNIWFLPPFQMIQRERTEIVNQTDWEKKGSVGALINLSGQDEDKDAKKEKSNKEVMS